MSSMNRRPNKQYRPSTRSSAPHFDRRANSSRRDIRMNNRRRGANALNLGPILFLAVLLVIGIVLFFIFVGKDPSSNTDSPSTPPAPTLDSPPAVNTDPPTDPPPEYTSPSVIESPNATENLLIYMDDRAPNYIATNPKWETIRFEWERQDNRGTMWIEISVDAEMYAHYRGLTRYHGIDNYHNYINDSNNKAIISDIVAVIRDVADDLSYSDAAVAREVAKFVQDAIEYQYDSDTTGEDEYPRYPIETLYERQGDCEDTSILMAALLKELGYEVGFLHIPGHVAVALRTADNYDGGAYYEINGHRYLFIESTGSGWNIGDIPEEFQEAQATFYLIP